LLFTKIGIINGYFSQVTPKLGEIFFLIQVYFSLYNTECDLFYIKFKKQKNLLSTKDVIHIL